jgi:uncharacterized membrane protein YqjE
MAEASFAGGVRGMLRGVLVTTLALARARLELLSTEVQEEKARLVGVFAYGGAAILLLAAGMVFLAAFLTVLLWETHRLLVLGISAAAFIGAGLTMAMMARRHAGTGVRPFEASLGELARDQAAAEGDKSQSP